MRLNKIKTPKIVLYTFLIIAIIIHFVMQGVGEKNIIDFILSSLIIIILSIYIINSFIKKSN